MKKFLLNLSFFFALSFLFSCNTEDMRDVDTNTLQGSWKLIELQLETPLDINNDGIVSTNVLEEVDYLIDANLVFNNASEGSIFYDSKVSFNSGVENGEVFYMVASSKSGDDAPVPFSYTSSNDGIFINYDISFGHDLGSTSTLTKANNQLYMKVTNGFVIKDIDTFEESVSQDVIYVFSKQ